MTGLILAGALMGLLLGSSMGIAVGGTAYNAAFFLIPFGAFIGWLASQNIGVQGSKDPTRQEKDSGSENPETTHNDTINAHLQSDRVSLGPAQRFGWSIMALLATIWNFHIDLLATIGVLPTFVRQPMFFFGLCAVVSFLFPPFLILYFCAWLGASFFGIERTTNYRAEIG